MAWPGWPGCSQEETLDFWTEMAESETGQTGMVFWSSLEAIKDWLVSFALEDEGDGDGDEMGGRETHP